MSIHQDAMDLLKNIYETYQQVGNYSVERSVYLNYPKRQKLTQLISYLTELGYITDYAPCVGFPISVRPTATGIQCIEQIQEHPSQISIHVSGDNKGIIGASVSGNTLNMASSFHQFQETANKESLTAEERKQLLAVVNEFYDKMEKKQTIQKGLFSNVAHILTKHQTLLVPLETALISYLLNK